MGIDEHPTEAERRAGLPARLGGNSNLGNWERGAWAGREAEPARRPATLVDRLTHSWAPEAIALSLAVLTVGVGPAVVRFAENAARQIRVAAEAAPWGYQRSWLGIEDGWNRGPTAGVSVASVDPYGASAGILRQGDVISAFDGRPVTTPFSLHAALANEPAGTIARLTVDRGAKVLHLDVRLSPTP